MKLSCLAIAAFLAVALPAAAVRSEQTPASAADHVPQIAVVRAAQVTRDCSEAKQLNQSLSARVNQMNQERAQKEAEIQKLKEQQTQLKSGSAQYNEMRDKIDDQVLSLELWVKKMQIELDRRQKAGLKSIYDHVNQAVQQIAEDRHLDLVLADNSPDFMGPDLDKVTLPQFEQMLAARGVLFATKKADITGDVLLRVEATFRSQKSEAASAGPSTPPAH
jgi:Skp family chaperone for outer membrane proteins